MTTAKTCQLKLIFEAVDHFLLLNISEEEAIRFRNAMDSHDTTKGRPLHWLSTLDDVDVLINLDNLKLCHVLYEPSAHVMHKFAANTDEDDTVLIGLAGAKESFRSDCDSPDNIYTLFALAESTPTEQFLSYSDADGEEVFINLKHVNYLQAPTWLVQEGMDADLAELEATE